jgi:hypothetical protein
MNVLGIDCTSHPCGGKQLTALQCSFLEGVLRPASDVSGFPIQYVVSSPADYLSQTWTQMKDPWPHAFASLCASIAQGRYARVSNDIETLTGRLRKNLVAYFSEHWPQCMRAFAARGASEGDGLLTCSLWDKRHTYTHNTRGAKEWSASQELIISSFG